MMAPDFHSELIRDIQIGLRKAAGIPSYDPDDSALPTVPSIEEAVAAIDPSLPDYLCCRRCHGGLLRGINTTLCIYCGAEQGAEGVSRSISFNSTEGYRKFLQSLNLDGSEIINLEDEPKDSSKVQDSPKASVTLSSILDMEMTWPRHVKESDNSTASKAPSQVALVSLSGIDLDNFFSDQKNEVSSRSSTSLTTSNEPGISARDAHLPSVHSNAVLSSTINETASSARNATAEIFSFREQDVDPHINLLSSSQKFGFQEGQLDRLNWSSDAKGGESEDAFTDWETDYQSASSVTFEAKFKPNDAFQNFVDFQSSKTTTANTESIQIDLFQNISNFQSDNSTDITLASSTIDPFQNSSGFQSLNFAESSFIDLFQKLPDSPSTNSGMDRTDSRGIAHLKFSGTEMSDQSTNIGHSVGKGWFQYDISSQSSIKVMNEIDQLESISRTIVDKVKKEEEETPVKVSWTQDDFMGKDDDLFDDWQGFTSTNAGNFSSLQPVTNDYVYALSSEAKLGDLEDFEFGSFVQSDSVSAALNDLQRSSEGNNKETDDSDANRTNQSSEKAVTASSIHKGLYFGKDTHDSSKDKLDMLMAQIPDLSFMLEDSLCIPKKPSSS